MDFKVLILLVFAINCNAQVRLPVVTTQNNQYSSAGSAVRTVPSGNVRQFLTYPTLRARDEGVAIAPVLSNNIGYYQQAQAAQAVVPDADILERIATLGLTNGLTGGIALGAKPQVLGPVIAAIITQRTAEVVDVPVPQDVIVPQILIVEPNLLPVTIEFRSQSSPVNINQVHIPGPPGEYKETRSEEEPDRVLHEVVKPVIQEVREIIQPFRRITQQILPVQEEIHSVVARGENQKVIQEIEIPPPAPLVVPVAPAPVAVAQRVAVGPRVAVAAAPIAAAVSAVRSPVTFERTVSVEPTITSFGQQFAASPALTGTVVRAGVLGGTRIIQAPGIYDTGINGQGLGTRLQITGLSARNNIKREAIEERPIEETSLNNRPNGQFKKEVVLERLSS